MTPDLGVVFCFLTYFLIISLSRGHAQSKSLNPHTHDKLYTYTYTYQRGIGYVWGPFAPLLHSPVSAVPHAAHVHVLLSNGGLPLLLYTFHNVNKAHNRIGRSIVGIIIIMIIMIVFVIMMVNCYERVML